MVATGNEQLLNKIAMTIVEGDTENCVKLVQAAILKGVDAYRILAEGLSKGMDIVGEKFRKHEYFVPELIWSAQTLKAALDLLKPHLKVEKVKTPTRIVIGSVYGDIHDVGKNIIKIMLELAGFKVFDLGIDVPPERFVEEVKRINADIVAMSALTTTTMFSMRDVIEELKKAGLRNRVKVVVGGLFVDQAFAREVGADAYGKDAMEALEKIRKLLRGKAGGK